MILVYIYIYIYIYIQIMLKIYRSKQEKYDQLFLNFLLNNLEIAKKKGDMPCEACSTDRLVYRTVYFTGLDQSLLGWDENFSASYVYAHIYEGGLKSSYDVVISAVMTFLTNGIQTLQPQWKKCVNCKRDSVEK